MTLSLGGNEREGKEHAPEEAEGSGGGEDEGEFAEGTDEVADMVLFSGVDETGGGGEVCDDEEEEDQEAADAHGPAEAEEVEEASEHDGEDDAAETGAAGGDA